MQFNGTERKSQLIIWALVLFNCFSANMYIDKEIFLLLVNHSCSSPCFNEVSKKKRSLKTTRLILRMRGWKYSRVVILGDSMIVLTGFKANWLLQCLNSAAWFGQMCREVWHRAVTYFCVPCNNILWPQMSSRCHWLLHERTRNIQFGRRGCQKGKLESKSWIFEIFISHLCTFDHRLLFVLTNWYSLLHDCKTQFVIYCDSHMIID